MVRTLAELADRVGEAIRDDYPQAVIDARIDVLLAAWTTEDPLPSEE